VDSAFVVRQMHHATKTTSCATSRRQAPTSSMAQAVDGSWSRYESRDGCRSEDVSRFVVVVLIRTAESEW